MKPNVRIPAMCLAAVLLIPGIGHARIFNMAGKDQACGPGSHFLRNATAGWGSDGKQLYITVCATNDRLLPKSADAADKLPGQDADEANKAIGKSVLPVHSGTR